MANRFGFPYLFDSSATTEQRVSEELIWHQSPIPAFLPNSVCTSMSVLPDRTHSAYYKTRMCAKFMSGFCPKGGNCNFAHCMEELRRPHGNGDGIVVFPQEDLCVRNEHNPRASSECFGQSEEQKLNKNNICRKFYNGEMCPYGVKCSFIHIKPGSFQDYTVSNPKPLCWKTRICHKWSTSGDCPYGDKCSYAHGDAELRKVVGDHGELLVEKFVDAAPPKYAPNLSDAFSSKKPKAEPLEHSSALDFQPRSRFHTLKKINGIYGDWIDDII